MRRYVGSPANRPTSAQTCQPCVHLSHQGLKLGSQSFERWAHDLNVVDVPIQGLSELWSAEDCGSLRDSERLQQAVRHFSGMALGDGASHRPNWEVTSNQLGVPRKTRLGSVVSQKHTLVVRHYG